MRVHDGRKERRLSRLGVLVGDEARVQKINLVLLILSKDNRSDSLQPKKLIAKAASWEE